MLPARLPELLSDTSARVTVLTGAGISAESGIPTFRGPEGYWTVGSKVYMPEEIATHAEFTRDPRLVWEWYLYRFGICLRAAPNAGHLALVEMERRLGDRFLLITQNIDNLHLRAGSTRERTFQIHGNITCCRCAADCNPALSELHQHFHKERAAPTLSPEELALLHCQDCAGWLRPHVLWFDEYYDEEHFRFDSSINAAAQTDLLIVVGTSGATNLPNHVAAIVHGRGGLIVDIDVNDNPFADMARASAGGGFIQATAAQTLPELLPYCP